MGLFPGSRSGEIKRMLPIFLDAAKLIQENRKLNNKPELQFVLPIANTINEQDISPFNSTLDELSVTLSKEPFYDVIQSCDVIISASGTAILEIGLLEVPMVIVLKVAAISYFIFKKLATVRYAGLVNIIPGKEVVKEFIQHDAIPENIAKEAIRLLDDKKYYETMQHELSLIRKQLGGGNGSRDVAELAYRMLNDTE